MAQVHDGRKPRCGSKQQGACEDAGHRTPLEDTRARDCVTAHPQHRGHADGRKQKLRYCGAGSNCTKSDEAGHHAKGDWHGKVADQH